MFSSLKNIRIEAGLFFQEESAPVYDANLDEPVSGDGSTTVFYTFNHNLIDVNGDDIVDTEAVDGAYDVIVYVNGESVEISEINATQGKITLAEAPADNATIKIDYAWSSHTNSRVLVYQRRAYGEILGAVSSRYTMPLSDNADYAGSPAESLLEGLEAVLTAGLLMTTNYTEETSGTFNDGKEMTRSARATIEAIKTGVTQLLDINEVELPKKDNRRVKGYPTAASYPGPAFTVTQEL